MKYLLIFLFFSLSFYQVHALEQETVDAINKCFVAECEGRNVPGGECSTHSGGPLHAGYGGDCYAGPGGPLSAGPGGPLSASPGGPLYAGPGGLLDAGPGGACYAGPGGECQLDENLEVKDTCPKLCSLRYLLIIALIEQSDAETEEDEEEDQ